MAGSSKYGYDAGRNMRCDVASAHTGFTCPKGWLAGRPAYRSLDQSTFLIATHPTQPSWTGDRLLICAPGHIIALLLHVANAGDWERETVLQTNVIDHSKLPPSDHVLYSSHAPDSSRITHTKQPRDQILWAIR